MDTSEIIKSGFSARVICYEDLGRVLITQRSEHSKFRSLCHDLPGGKSDLNELPIETAAREFEEETGFIIKPKRLISLYDQPQVHVLEDINTTREVHIFVCRISGIEPPATLNSEGLKYEWLHPLEAIHRLDQAVQEKAMRHAHSSNYFRLLSPRFMQ